MSATTTTSAARTARLVAAGLGRTTAAIHAVPVSMPDEPPAPGTFAGRFERIAELYTRRARWWAVLERAAVTDHAIATVYLRAVVLARLADTDEAADWSRRAAEMTEHARAAETRRAAASDVLNAPELPELVGGVSA